MDALHESAGQGPVDDTGLHHEHIHELHHHGAAGLSHFRGVTATPMVARRGDASRRERDHRPQGREPRP